MDSSAQGIGFGDCGAGFESDHSAVCVFLCRAAAAAPIIIKNVLKKEPLLSYKIPAIVLPKEDTRRFIFIIEKFTGKCFLPK